MGCERPLALALLLLAGCHGGDTGDDIPRNGVQVRFDLPDAEGDDHGGDDHSGDVHDGRLGISELELRVGGVLFEGHHTVEGEVSTSNDTVAVVDVVSGAGAADVAVVDLAQGTYEPATVSVDLVPDTLPSVHLVGLWEDTRIELVVTDALTLDADTERFDLFDGPDPIVWFGLHPEDWFHEQQIPDVPAGTVFRIAADEDKTLYDAVVAQIASTTHGTFPGEAPYGP